MTLDNPPPEICMAIEEFPKTLSHWTTAESAEALRTGSAVSPAGKKGPHLVYLDGKRCEEKATPDHVFCLSLDDAFWGKNAGSNLTAVPFRLVGTPRILAMTNRSLLDIEKEDGSYPNNLHELLEWAQEAGFDAVAAWENKELQKVSKDLDRLAEWIGANTLFILNPDCIELAQPTKAKKAPAGPEIQ